MDEEIWKTIPGHEGYMASNKGRIIRKPYVLSIWKKQGKGPGNYLNVKVDSHQHTIHRLVAATFIDNPTPNARPFVNHIDGDKMNNRVENLEWVSNIENMRHARKLGLFGKHEAMVRGGFTP